MHRRLLSITGGLVMSLAIAGTAFADSCANISAAPPACHPDCTEPVIRGNWVWLPSIGVPFEAWGFGVPGGDESVANGLPGDSGNYQDGDTESLLGKSAYCTEGVNTDRSEGVISGCH